MDRLLVVDGSNLLFQMFYGMPERIRNREGRPIQGTLGFVGALLKILRMTAPTHAAVLFDGEHENDRARLDGDYKANRVDYSRVPEEDSPFSQLPDIRGALDLLGLRHAETADCEADDWMAGYALTYGRDGDVVIASQDSDLFQLITDRVRILRYRGKRTVLCDREYIRGKLGIEPSQYADFKALTGDPADHIRGIGGVGPKTAAALLRQFGDLEGILANAERITKPSVRSAVMENADRAKTNYCLIRLGNRGDLPFEMEELRWRDSGFTTGRVLEEIGLQP